MKVENKNGYIIFRFKEKKPKTEVYEIVSQKSLEVIGEIKWFPKWRKYALYPADKTVFEEKCLSDIIDFLTTLMKNRKANRQNGNMSIDK